MKKLTAEQYNKIITKHRSKFQLGYTMDFATFKSLFKEVEDANTLSNATPRSAMKVVAQYSAMNKLLARRGLVIKSSDYYAKFTVTQKVDTKIKALKSKSTRAVTTAVRLQDGIKRHSSVWSPLTTCEINELD